MRRCIPAAVTAAAFVLMCCTGCAAAEPPQGDSAPQESSAAEIPAFSLPDNILGEPSDLVPAVTVDSYAVPESAGMDFIRELKLGWNLGNTFDASDVKSLTAEHEMEYESVWCGTVTTIENIAAIKAAGFRTVRIPVSWHNHVDENDRISKAWMARVKEVADWCMAMDLYVIINTHHDNALEWYYPDEAHMARSEQYLTAVWSQIAETFRDYDEHLILESLNEPRLVGTDYEWWFDPGSAKCQEAVGCINRLNQLFTDTVRASGGNNAQRWLLCPGYAASVDGACDENFRVPEDPAGKVIVSVHAYTPYHFALNKAGTKEWSLDSGSDTGEILTMLDRLYGTFVQNGQPVLIGEFGALNKDNLEARTAFSAFYTKAARARGISCLWWDNNAFTGSGENFGLLYRRSSTFSYPEIVQALLSGSETG